MNSAEQYFEQQKQNPEFIVNYNQIKYQTKLISSETGILDLSKNKKC